MADYTLKCTGEQLDAAVEKANSAFVALDNKLNKDDVYDGLDNEDASKALSARQGKLLKNWVDNCITYNEDIDIGSHSFTMSNVFTVASDSSLYTQITPGSISLQNPIGTLSIGTYSLSVNGTTIYWPTLSADPNGKYLALRSDIPPVDSRFSETSTNPVENRIITEEVTDINKRIKNNESDIGLLSLAANDGWKFRGKVGNKKFTKDLGEIKPGSSGTTTGANIFVDVNAYEKTIDGVVKYKTVLDVIVETNPFELKHLDLKALLSSIGSKWFFPRVNISRSDMNSSAFNNMIARLYEDKEAVSMSFSEVSVSRDMSTVLGTLNASGGVLPIGGMNADGFNLFAVIMELDRDNANKNIRTTGGHWKIVLFHPNPYNI